MIYYLNTNFFVILILWIAYLGIDYFIKMSVNIRIILAVVVIIAGILYKKYGNNGILASDNRRPTNRVIFSQEELSKYNGITYERLYLAVLGHVFDVTDGDKHYGQGSNYNYFIGKDGSRGLITGDFKDESPLKDDVIDLPCNDLLTLVNWRRTYRKKYKFVGLLEGRFYGSRGEETEYLNNFKSRLKDCKEEKINSEKENHKYPPCNMMWNEDDSSRVWCTKSSGGVTRDWVGVPRQLFTPGEKYPRCVCINLDNDISSSNLLKLYDNCPPSSTSCPPIQS